VRPSSIGRRGCKQGSVCFNPLLPTDDLVTVWSMVERHEQPRLAQAVPLPYHAAPADRRCRIQFYMAFMRRHALPITGGASQSRGSVKSRCTAPARPPMGLAASPWLFFRCRCMPLCPQHAMQLLVLVCRWPSGDKTHQHISQIMSRPTPRATAFVACRPLLRRFLLASAQRASSLQRGVGHAAY
jgi:hypothetical protein